MESHAISNRQLRASSEWNANHGPSRGRLHIKNYGGVAAWCAHRNDANQWLQVDLLRRHRITRVATQGRLGYSQWVTKYRLQYSDSGVSFQYYKELGEITDKVKLVT